MIGGGAVRAWRLGEWLLGNEQIRGDLLIKIARNYIVANAVMLNCSLIMDPVLTSLFRFALASTAALALALLSIPLSINPSAAEQINTSRSNKRPTGNDIKRACELDPRACFEQETTGTPLQKGKEANERCALVKQVLKATWDCPAETHAGSSQNEMKHSH